MKNGISKGKSKAKTHWNITVNNQAREYFRGVAVRYSRIVYTTEAQYISGEKILPD